MATIQLPPDFKEFLRLLNASQVEYLVICGYAVAFRGFPRPTGDLDVWIAIHPSNVDKVVKVLQEFGFAGPDVTRALFDSPGRIIRMGVAPVRIEIQTAISGVTFDECFQQRIIGELDGVTANVINVDHLRRNKRAAGRHKDLSDLESLP